MTDASTGAMQQFRVGPPHDSAGPEAGLVLLYAEAFAALPPVFPLVKTSILVGRDEAADVRLPVSAVSRRHAELQWERGRWSLRDLGSRNGTLVDGHLVEEVELDDCAEIRIGDSILKLVEKDAASFAPFRIDGVRLQGATGRPAAGPASPRSSLVGGLQMHRIAEQLARVAPTALSVLLLGESGTGKEVAARELHELSRRRGKFCAVNCAALPGNLIESELFGYKKGAFSGADRDKPGLFKVADGGTLLLDEIGDMPPLAQAKLLRVLQSKEVLPLGATTPEPVDVRVVAATHRDLARLQAEDAFRADLFARLNEVAIELPPLRERKEDVYLLVRTFLERHGRPELETSFPFMAALLHYDWPYNVRELEAAIKRAAALAVGPTLLEEHLPKSVQAAIEDYAKPKSSPTERAEAPSESELRELLSRHDGNVAAVGRELGKARMQVHRWMKRYGIVVDDYRSGAPE
jgi:transcriptional regulator with GAF, ATPase, and Fis domain